MGNYKDYGALIDSLVDRGKPFLIVKYCLSSMDRVNNAYEVVTIGSHQLNYTPIEREIAIKAIRKHELPMLYEMDNRNMIWGTTDFKQTYRKKGVHL